MHCAAGITSTSSSLTASGGMTRRSPSCLTPWATSTTGCSCASRTAQAKRALYRHCLSRNQGASTSLRVHISIACLAQNTDSEASRTLRETPCGSSKQVNVLQSSPVLLLRHLLVLQVPAAASAAHPYSPKQMLAPRAGSPTAMGRIWPYTSISSSSSNNRGRRRRWLPSSCTTSRRSTRRRPCRPRRRRPAAARCRRPAHSTAGSSRTRTRSGCARCCTLGVIRS